MKKIFLLVLLIGTSILFAQNSNQKLTGTLKNQIVNDNGSTQYLIWVTFTDKGNALQKLYKSPDKVVSEKSLERRAKVLPQSELIDYTDLPVNQNYIKQVQSLGFTVKQKSKWFNSISGYADTKMINKISALNCVKQIDDVKKYVKKNNFLKEGSQEINENHNNLNKSTSVGNIDYGHSYDELNQINVIAAQELGYTGQGVTICVLDAGVSNLSHEVFKRMRDNNQIIAMYDFVNHDSIIANQSDLGEGSHGTYTLALIGGYKEGQMIGPAYNSKYILAKTENTASESTIEEDNWIAAVEWADSIGVDVTSTSLSYRYDLPHNGDVYYSSAQMDGNTAKITIAADLAVKKGIVVVVAAGNEAQTHPNDQNTLGAPADGDSVITVGAVNVNGDRASFSSFGPTADGRIKPDVMADGVNNYIPNATPGDTSDYLSYYSGTSFATPLVAGACAIILSANPNLTPIQIRDALWATSSRSDSPDDFYGYGIIDVIKAMNYLHISTGNVGKKNIPDGFKLYQNYPNPFNPDTKIRFDLVKTSYVNLSLFNILGEKVSTLLNQSFSQGEHEYILKGDNLASGIYFVRLQAGENISEIKINLLK